MTFKRMFDLAERFGRGSANRKVFGGKRYILLSDGLTKRQAESYAARLRAMGCLERVVREYEQGDYMVYYWKSRR
jgi:hypothetical protein